MCHSYTFAWPAVETHTPDCLRDPLINRDRSERTFLIRSPAKSQPADTAAVATRVEQRPPAGWLRASRTPARPARLQSSSLRAEG